MKNKVINALSVFSFVLVFSNISVSTAHAAEDVPDLSGFWTVNFGFNPDAQVMIDNLPEGAVFIDDAGAGELAEGEYSGLTLTEAAMQEIDNYDFDDEWTVANTCVPPSVVFYMQAPFPIEIFQGRDLIVFKIEYFDMVRLIFMDGRGHPENMPHSKNGHSIGHWEGDELVVETAYISPGTFMNNGFNHSEDLLMTERFKLSEDGNSLWSTEVSEDSAIFNGSAARFVSWRKVPGDHVYPYECDPSFGR